MIDYGKELRRLHKTLAALEHEAELVPLVVPAPGKVILTREFTSLTDALATTHELIARLEELHLRQVEGKEVVCEARN